MNPDKLGFYAAYKEQEDMDRQLSHSHSLSQKLRKGFNTTNVHYSGGWLSEYPIFSEPPQKNKVR
jgi:hypothetical protein